MAGLSLGLFVPMALRAPRVGWAMLFGASLAILNTIAAYGIVLWSERQAQHVLLPAVLGGMAARLVVLLSATLAGILLLDLPRLPLAISLLSYFMVFLIFEVVQLHKPAVRSLP
jgi:hypothetical protein